MNKIHRTVWSASRQAYVVAAETAKAHGKPSSTVKSAVLAVALALGSAGATAAGIAYVGKSTDDGTGATASPNCTSSSNTTCQLSDAIASGTPTIVLNTNMTVTGVMKKLIDHNIALQNNGTTKTISGGGSYRPLFIKSGTVSITGINFSNGSVKGGSARKGGAGAGLGGALFIYSGTVTLDTVTFATNAAFAGVGAGNNAGGGGGMYGVNSNAKGGAGMFGYGDASGNGAADYLGGVSAVNATAGGSGGNGGFGGGGGAATATSLPQNVGGNGGFGGGGGNGAYGTGGNGGFGGGGGAGYFIGGNGGFGGGGGAYGGNGTAGGTAGYGGTPGTGGNSGGGAGAGFGGAVFVRAGTLKLTNVNFNNNDATNDTAKAASKGKGGALFVCVAGMAAGQIGDPSASACAATIDATSTGVCFGSGGSANSASSAGSSVNDNANYFGPNLPAGFSSGCPLPPPTVSSSAPVGTPAANATGFDFAMTFSEAVSGVDASDFTLTASGTATGTVGTPTTTDNIVWTVPISGVSGTGTLRLDLKSSGTGIAATAAGTTAIASGYTGGTTQSVDTEGATVSNISSPANASYKAATNLDFIFTFNEAVTVVTTGGTPRIPLTIGGNSVYADYQSGSGTNALTFRYTVQAGDTAASGISMTSPIQLNGGTMKDAASNDATLTFTPPTLTSVLVDNTVPAADATTPISKNDVDSSGAYSAGDIITLNFSEPVLTSNLTASNITISNTHSFGTGPVIAAVSPSGGYASSFTITLGSSPTVASGDTLTLANIRVMDRAANPAADSVVFTVPDMAFTAPNPPTGVTVTAGGGQGTVSFTPGSNGGSAITGYSVSCTSSNGGAAGTGSGSASPIVVTGLTTGKDYTCTVTATNGVGTSSASSASSSTTVLPTSAIVTSTADSGVGSLRQALLDVAAGGTITFDSALANQTITLASTLTIGKSVTIDGGTQKVTVNGGGTVRDFTISDGATVTLQKLTIANGYNDTNGGGGIRNGNGTLTLNQVTFSGNAGTGAGGGGLYNASGAVTISNSLFIGNLASNGGGLRTSGGTLSLTNVTFSGNSATGTGGALWAGSSTVTVNNVTLANNSAVNGGGISNQSGTPVTLKNTLLAANTGGNCYGAPIANVGYNLDDGTSCSFGSSNNSQSSANPLLGTLADNGGFTQTLALGDGSPAINAGNNATCATTDQRGITRPLSGADACDIGAFELMPPPDAPTSVSAVAGNHQATVTFTAPASDNGTAITGYTVTSSPGNLTCSATPPATSCTVTGLTNGTAYTFTATASNGATSASSTASNSVTPAAVSVPGQPTLTGAVPGNGQVTVSFTAPASNGGASISEYTVSCDTANSFNYAFNQTGAASPITVSGLANGVAYKCLVKAQNSAGDGDYSGLSASFTPVAPSTTPAPSGGNDYTPPAPSNPTLPSGGGTVAPTGGQTVTVTDNGKEGSSISLPSQTTTTGSDGKTTTTANTIKVDLPGTGTVSASSTSEGTKLGVTQVTLPGSTTSVSAVTVDQGSASFTASKTGQAMAGLKNGIVVISGTNNSQVTVDATGTNAKIGVKSSDTLIVPTGVQNVSGTSVDLPAPTTGGAAKSVNVSVGGKEISIQASQPNTSMTFKVVDVGGVQTPVVEVTGAAQVSSSGDNQPIVSVGGNVIKTGKSGGGSQVCNTIVQASSDSSSDVVHVVTCYIVLDAGSFSGLGGGGTGTSNHFAAIKDGIVWAGETAEFDKSGKVTSAYVGTRQGDTDAVGDDLVPGGGKFAANGYHVGAFIPRLTGTPLRLSGAKLDERIFETVNNALGVTTQPATPTQSDQGVLNFTFTGNINNQGVQNANVTYTITSDTASILPSRRIRVDTSRADGVSIGAEGDVEVATGGLVTTFAPSLADPKAFADRVSQVLPGAATTLRWNGSWQVDAADGTTYVGRPQWSYWSATPGAETFSSTADGNVLYSDNGHAQPLFPDFYDYDALQGTFRNALNDPTLTVLPRMDGTAVAMVNGRSYTLAPQWNVFKPTEGKPAWWVENEVVYIKNADGTAQGFTVK